MIGNKLNIRGNTLGVILWFFILLFGCGTINNKQKNSDIQSFDIVGNSEVLTRAMEKVVVSYKIRITGEKRVFNELDTNEYLSVQESLKILADASIRQFFGENKAKSSIELLIKSVKKDFENLKLNANFKKISVE